MHTYTMFCILELTLGKYMSTFDLKKAVCNHGFFMMAPNLWQPSTKTLNRPLRLANGMTSVLVSIQHPPNSSALVIEVHDTAPLMPADQQAILDQVARMLRISEEEEMDVKQFHEIHPEAKKKCFGRLFRSPSLFEDAVKSILLINCHWKRSLDMAEALCKLQADLAKKPLKVESVNGEAEVRGNFPSARELANLDKSFLQKRCNLGYRARVIINLANNFEKGKLKLIEPISRISDIAMYAEAYKKLCSIKGFGKFACNNVLMCIGFYQRVPADTETVRLLKQVHSRESCTNKTVEEEAGEIYNNYTPFQCLAYWFDLVEDYQGKLGNLSELDGSDYHKATRNFYKRSS